MHADTHNHNKNNNNNSYCYRNTTHLLRPGSALNKIKAGTVKRINQSEMPFKQRVRVAPA